jgi:hypothetical protein
MKRKHNIVNTEYKRLFDNLKTIYETDYICLHICHSFCNLSKEYSYKYINNIIEQNYDLIKSKIDNGLYYGFALIKHLIKRDIIFKNGGINMIKN